MGDQTKVAFFTFFFRESVYLFCVYLSCTNMKNYLSRWFFLRRFHLVFHIVYFSTREMFCNNVVLKICSLWNEIPYTFFRIESPKITALGAFVFVFLFDIDFSLSLLESDLLSIGSFSFRSWFFFFFFLTSSFKKVGSIKIFISVCFSFMTVLKGPETGICGCH